MFHEFKAFLLRGNVVDLAVAVVIGAAFSNVVKAFTDLITNLVAIPGKTDFTALKFTLGGGVFKYGLALQETLNFVIIAAAIFFLVVKPLNALAARRRAGEVVEEADAPMPTDEAVLLREIRDLLAASRS